MNSSGLIDEAMESHVAMTCPPPTNHVPADAEAADAADAGPASNKQADMIVWLAGDIGLFHESDGTCYADITIDGHRETWPINSGGFHDWLTHQFYHSERTAPEASAVQKAVSLFAARAKFDGPERPVFVRVAEYGGKVYIDLADELWRAVEIDQEGWRVVTDPPVRFRRPNGLRSLPLPQSGGSIHALRGFLNVDEKDLPLVVGWILAALLPTGPYPLLVVSGEHGSAKSNFVRLLKMLIDPAKPLIRALSRQEHDLSVAAKNTHILVFDNVSTLPVWLSDALCRLSTGGGFAARQLYSDDSETLFEFMRPVLMNGIDDMIKRPDLADRAIWFHLKVIPENSRRTEKDIIDDFRAEHPKLLGALFDGIAEGLRQRPNVHVENAPRMADFAFWGQACETAYWPEGTFMAAYSGNRKAAIEKVLDSDPVASAIRSLMASQPHWEGTATRLLERLSEIAGDEKYHKDWPKNAQTLSTLIRRSATFLRKSGIRVDHDRQGRDRNRIITIAASPADGGEGTQSASAPSAASAQASADGTRLDEWKNIAEAEAYLTGYDADDADAADDVGGTFH